MKGICFLLGVFIIVLCLSQVTNAREGFISNDYTNCINKGFTKEFCVQTPYASNVVGTCLCGDGNVGVLMPGFQGQCVCSPSQFLYN